MVRVVFEVVLTFLAPFLVYFVYRLIRPPEKELADAERVGPYLVLTLIGILLVGASLVGNMLLTDRGKGAYVPAVVKDGVVQPGHVE
jgi:hypothetical protein